MFQSFDVQTSPDQGPPRLKALRAAMGTLDGFLIPRADKYQGEYVAPCDERLAWLTGFTGSAGFAVVLKDLAGVFVDGRYRLQVVDQVAADFTPVHWPETQLADWLRTSLPNGGTVGFDPWLHTVSEMRALSKTLAEDAIQFQPVENLVDQVWSDRPSAPDAVFTPHPDDLAGETAAAKCTRLSDGITSGCFILTQPDSIAWLLNIRSTDIARNPVPHAFAVLHADGQVDLYARPGKADAVADQLSNVTLRAEDEFLADLADLPSPVRIDPKSCPTRIATALVDAGADIIHQEDPCLIPKACKSAAEVAGARAAHLRDAGAMVRFLAWLDKEAPKGGLSEIDVVQKLEGFRRDTNQLRDISFETICGSGPNGAIVHYRVSESTNRPVAPGELLLVDSGGQYMDGTTDITRTIAVGTPTTDAQRCYTLVLQGMIAVSRARFPQGVGGQHLDTLARMPLWLAGKDYDHGTGHGVGSYLSVHEGPQSLSRRNTVPLQAGMILSNEPGYYRSGAFGIRIENLIVTQPAPPIDGGDDRDMLHFETLTWVPFDRHLILTQMLTMAERDWIDRYHADTMAKIAPLINGSALDWLTTACAPL